MFWWQRQLSLNYFRDFSKDKQIIHQLSNNEKRCYFDSWGSSPCKHHHRCHSQLVEWAQSHLVGFFLKYPNLKTGCAPSAPQRSLTILHAFEIKILFHDCYHSLILLPVWWTGSHFSNRTRQCRFPIPINEMIWKGRGV